MTHPLVKVCSEGRSLIFCLLDVKTAEAIETALRNAGIKAEREHGGKHFESDIRTFDGFGRACAMIITNPALVHGWKCKADRVVWIGEKPLINTPNFATYSQAMARADRAWRQAEKFAFTEQQLIDG